MSTISFGQEKMCATEVMSARWVIFPLLFLASPKFSNIIILTTLIKGLCLKGEVHKALHFHDNEVALGFWLDQVTYGTLINGLCRIGETRAAR